MSISARLNAFCERLREWLLAPVFAEIAKLRADIAKTRGAGWNGTNHASHVLDPRVERHPEQFDYQYRQHKIKG